MAGTHDTIVLVHGAGDGEVQGGFLVEFAEPLVRWLAENGAEELIAEPISIRRGARPARLNLSGRLPDPDRPGSTRNFDWRLVEARWAGEFATRSERTAAAWTLRALPDALIDHLGYYDSVWRFWRAITSVAGFLAPLANAPANPDAQSWRYRYNPSWPVLLRLPYALWFGVLMPLLLLAIASPLLLPATPLWLFGGLLDSWVRAYWNGLYRLVLIVAWLPVLLVGAVTLTALLLLTLLPVQLPFLGTLRRGTLRVLRLGWLDHAAFDVDRVNGAAIEEAVGATIMSELLDASTLTVVGHGHGAVVAYETLAALARPMQQPDSSTPYVTVSQALSSIDRPLPRAGLPVTLVTVGGALNRALAWRRRPLIADPLPEGTRWVDVWSMHDPLAMGSVDRRLVNASGVPLAEARTTNTPTFLAAPSAYWANPAEVAATIADEVIAASATRVLPPSEGASPSTWTPRAAGTWEWRADHALADRACTVARRNRLVRALAVLRTATYAGIGAVAVTAFQASEGATVLDAARAAALPTLGASAAYVVGFAALEVVTNSFGRWWMARPCRHTRLVPSAVRV